MCRKLREQQAQEQKSRMVESHLAFPFWMLDVPDFSRAKPECVSFDGKARLWNEPYWESNFPPCERDDCLCRVIALGGRQLKRQEITLIDFNGTKS